MPGNRNCFEGNDATEAAPGLATAADGHNLFFAPCRSIGAKLRGDLMMLAPNATLNWFDHLPSDEPPPDQDPPPPGRDRPDDEDPLHPQPDEIREPPGPGHPAIKDPPVRR